jgi:hypothetical protein
MIPTKRQVVAVAQVYYADGAFHTTALVQGQTGAWTSVLPDVVSPRGDAQALADALDSVRPHSQRWHRDRPAVDVVPWDGNAGQVWQDATHLWSVRWYSDGSVLLVPQARFHSDEPDLARGEGWQRVAGAERTFGPPVSSSTVANKIVAGVEGVAGISQEL